MASKRTLGLSPTVLRKKFGAAMTSRNYRNKEIVFSQGDPADAVFYIQTGTVKLTAVSTRRKKAIIAFLQRGSFFGEGSLGEQPLRIYTARSIGQSSITLLRKESTVRALKRDPQFAALFIDYLLSRIVRIEEDFGGSILQFQRKATGAVSTAVWANN